MGWEIDSSNESRLRACLNGVIGSATNRTDVFLGYCVIACSKLHLFASMLRFFRVNDPYRLLAILGVLIICSIPLFYEDPVLTTQSLRAMVVGESIADGKRMYTQIYDSTAPFSAGVYSAIDFIMGRSTTGREILALVLIFFQASFFSILLINNRAYNDNTYVPGLIFGIICFISFDFLEVSPELLGSTLLLLALNNLFREIEFRVQRDETIFNLGIYLGAASAFLLSYAVFLIAAVVILLTFTRMSIRKTALLLLGFAFPHAILALIYFYRGEQVLLWEKFYLANFTMGEALISFRGILVLAIIPLIYFVFSLFMMTREARFTKYQSQLFQVMFIWLLFSILEVVVTREMTPHSFITVVPSLTYFFSHYLLLIRRKWIAETMLWILLVSIPLVSYLSRKGYIDDVDYSRMTVVDSPYKGVVNGKRVMILGDDLPLYVDNKLGGYLLEWRISREVVHGLNYYDNVIALYDQFNADPPDVIVDEHGLFPAIIKRIPALEGRYRKENNLYWRN